MEISVLGAGSWGTAMARLLAQRGHSVRLWSRDPHLAEVLDRQRESKKYLPGVALPRENLEFFHDLAETWAGGEVFLFALPSFAMRPIAHELAEILPKPRRARCAYISLAKGIERQSHKTMSEVVAEELGAGFVFSLSGPSFAAEVARDYPTTVVLAGHDLDRGRVLQQAFITPAFRVYLSRDIKGVELGGALKNIIAIAAGLADGLGFGDNAKGALTARGLAEIIRLGTSLGARKETFFGISGLGDLVATCTSSRSRNLQVGRRLAQRETLPQILASTSQVAEGVYAAAIVRELSACLQVDMPISRAVHALLYEGANPRQLMHQLMTREPKEEEL